MVGILFSYWGGLFSEAMWVSGRVRLVCGACIVPFFLSPWAARQAVTLATHSRVFVENLDFVDVSGMLFWTCKPLAWHAILCILYIKLGYCPWGSRPFDYLIMLNENLQDNHFLNPKPKQQGIDAQSWPKSGISKIFTIALCVRSGGGAWFVMVRDLVSWSCWVSCWCFHMRFHNFSQGKSTGNIRQQ